MRLMALDVLPFGKEIMSLAHFETKRDPVPSGKTRWYTPVSPLTCNKVIITPLTKTAVGCGRIAISVEHDTHAGFTGVTRCKDHHPSDKPIHKKGQ